MVTAERTDMDPRPPCDNDRDFWLQVRQGLLIQLSAIDKRLGLEPSRPRRERPERVRSWHNEDQGEYKTA